MSCWERRMRITGTRRRIVRSMPHTFALRSRRAVTGSPRCWSAILVIAAAVVTAACVNWLGPGPATEFAIVGAEEGRVAIVNLTLGRVGSWNTRLPPYQGAWTRSRNGSTVYWSAFYYSGLSVLLAIDMASLRIAWQDSLGALVKRSHLGPIAVSADYATSPTPDSSRLLVADARRDTATGIVVLDIATRDPVAFLGPLAVGPAGMASLGPNAAYPTGAVVAVGSRSTAEPSTGGLFVFDGAGLALRDSATLVPSVELHRGGLGQVIAAPDQVHVYIAGWSELYEYDLLARQVV